MKEALRATILAAAWCALAYGPGAASPRDRSVQIRLNSDDGITQRLGDALYRAFSAASEHWKVVPFPGGEVIVKIPGYVHWEKRGDRTFDMYEARLETAKGELLDTVDGECRDDELQVCANQILTKANSAAAMLP